MASAIQVIVTTLSTPMAITNAILPNAPIPAAAMGKAKKACGKPRATVIKVANQKGGKSSIRQAILAAIQRNRSLRAIVVNISVKGF